ncbi:MAG: class II fructose-bisphosphate aldolase, partial [Atribacterota bacterium]
MLVPMHELLKDAEKGKYAIPACNFCNLETMYPILEAAKELHAPIILQAAASEIYYFGEDLMTGCVKAVADRMGLTVALHLDHGRDYEEAIKCLRRGFTSVMFDGSELPYEKNLAITRNIVQAAHAVGISVEGELGKIMGAEDAAFLESEED